MQKFETHRITDWDSYDHHSGTHRLNVLHVAAHPDDSIQSDWKLSRRVGDMGKAPEVTRRHMSDTLHPQAPWWAAMVMDAAEMAQDDDGEIFLSKTKALVQAAQNDALHYGDLIPWDEDDTEGDAGPALPYHLRTSAQRIDVKLADGRALWIETQDNALIVHAYLAEGKGDEPVNLRVGAANVTVDSEGDYDLSIPSSNMHYIASETPAERGARMLDHIGRLYNAEPETDVQDALSDLMHAADAAGLDWFDVERMARNNYDEEKADAEVA